MPVVTALNAVREQLAEVETKLEIQEQTTSRLENLNRRLRWMLAGGVLVLAIVLVVGALVLQEESRRVDAIQGSRVEGCERNNRTVLGLTGRDEDIVREAIRATESDPALANAILETIDELPSSQSIHPIDCEALADD